MTNSNPNLAVRPQALTAEQAIMPGARYLQLQDDEYADRRLPYVTPPHAADRTFSFRLEDDSDRDVIHHMLKWATEKWWTSPICPLGDAEVKLTLKAGTLKLAELRWLFARLDLSDAMRSVERSSDYTGELRTISEDPALVTSPGAAELRQCAEGLERYASSLRLIADLAGYVSDEFREQLCPATAAHE